MSLETKMRDYDTAVELAVSWNLFFLKEMQLPINNE